MNKFTEEFFEIFKKSLQSITEPRFFKSERGYQGALIAEMEKHFSKPLFKGNPIVEQEYQKTLLNHEITIRPDIIIHIPFGRGKVKNRKQGNFIVIQLKLQANESDAIDDFEKIDLMFDKLNYPIGIFLNIDTPNTFFDCYKGDFTDRLYCFFFFLKDEKVIINEND